MNRSRTWFALSGVLLAVLLATPAPRADAQPPKGKKPWGGNPNTLKLIKLLDQTIDTKDFQQLLSLKQVVYLLYEKLNAEGKELPILIDAGAFREENPDDDDINDTPVQLPPLPRKITVGNALRLALSKAPSNNATLVVYGDRVEITTLKRASVEYKLKQRVLVNFDNQKLWQALRDLSEMTGTSIVIDNRVGDKEERQVSATFLNDITLAGALQTLTEMAELKFVVLKTGVIFVTTPVHADTLRKEKAIMEESTSPAVAGPEVQIQLLSKEFPR